MTDADLKEINTKLDMIIEYFHIGKKAPRDLSAEIDKKFIELTSRRQQSKKRK